MKREIHTCEHCNGLRLCKQKRGPFGRQSCEECLKAAGEDGMASMTVDCSVCGGSGYYEVNSSEDADDESHPLPGNVWSTSPLRPVLAKARGVCPACHDTGTYRPVEYEEAIEPGLTVTSCANCGYVRGSYQRPADPKRRIGLGRRLGSANGDSGGTAIPEPPVEALAKLGSENPSGTGSDHSNGSNSSAAPLNLSEALRRLGCLLR